MRRVTIAAVLVGFVATVYAANYAVQRWGIVPVGFGLVAPAGVGFAGLAFTLRAFAQQLCAPHAWVAVAILVGALVSWQVSGKLAAASAAGFASSETTAALIFYLIRRGWLRASVPSGLVGDLVDSLVFLTVAFGSLHYLGGQVFAKATMTLIAALAVASWGRRYAT